MECILLSPDEHFGSNCYVIRCGEDYAVVDPSVSFSNAVMQIGDVSDKIKYILLTHAHFDHIWALDSWVHATGVLPTLMNYEGTALDDPYANCSMTFLATKLVYSGAFNTVCDGDVLPFGDTKIEVLSTPGHTKGSCSYIIDNSIFVGDTLFSDGGYGRCDLPGGDSSLIRASITHILSLPKDMLVYTGHGRSTTISEASSFTYFIY